MMRQKIGVGLATITAMNAMIGAGIFSTPIKLISTVGAAGILTYVFVVVAVGFLAFSFARMAHQFPQAGSFYTYAYQWGGAPAGLIAGTSYLLGIIIAMGLLTQLAAMYVYDYVPLLTPYLIGLLILSCLVIITALGGVATRAAQLISIACTVFPLTLITLLCFTKARMANLHPFAPHGFSPILRATQTVIFGFFGFESTASLYGMVASPQKNVPRALLFALAIVSTIYFLFIFSIMLAMPPHFIATPTTPISHLLQILFPTKTWLIALLHFSITASFITVLNAMLFATSTLLISIEQKMLHPRVNILSLKPSIATLFLGVLIAAGYSLITNIDLFFDCTAMLVILAFVISLISLLFTRQTLWQWFATLMGLTTAGIIFYFAVEGIVRNLFLSR